MDLSSRSTAYSVAASQLTEPSSDGLKIDYEMPKIEIDVDKQDSSNTEPTFKLRTDLPSRLDAPLMPYPKCINEYLSSGNNDHLVRVFGDHAKAIRLLKKEVDKVWCEERYDILNYKTSLDDLKQFYKFRYSMRSETVHKAAFFSAMNMMKYDMSLMMKTKGQLPTHMNGVPEGMDIHLLIYRIRALLSVNKDMKSSTDYECSLKITEDGIYHFYSNNPRYSYHFLLHGQHFAVIHRDSEYAFMGPMTYLDYLYTLSDVNSNLTIILDSGEYDEFKTILTNMMEIVINRKGHNTLVNFFKSYESYCLYRADIQSGMLTNWYPVIDTIKSMVEDSNEISDTKISYTDAINYILYNDMGNIGDSLFTIIATSVQYLTPLQLLEASSLHKFTYFSEIKAELGIEKYLKRTHTERVVNKDYMHQLLGLTIKEFILNYTKSEGMPPEIRSPEDKKNIIKEYYRQSNMESLEDYPLGWWATIKIGKSIEHFEMTHPVEYAKDKGAITNTITFGPKDNKRELTQIIESSEYKYDEFLSDINVNPIPKKVTRIRTRKLGKFFRFPVRIVDKEKEQKKEGRKFGVATARFKHKLSEYMLKAKKVLKYFTGSYMTMTDNARKKDLHRLAQLLLDDKNIAIMLDIEGHNQSMQPSNTKDILEFIGNCYGEEGWGKLSHLFSNLTVYYYNPYEDDVIVSEGQLGGIEGWMNPVWSLITLQQTKLLKYRTNINIKAVAGYSDDVSMIIEQEDQSQEAIDVTLNKVGKDFLLGGFLMKPSQTAVSKYRITMLRTHWVKGQRADQTLKRLLAVTGASNQRVMAEDLELTSITASINSALEGSYHIKACVMLKWYKSCIITWRTFASLFEDRREKSMISIDNLPKKIASIIYNIDAAGIDDPRLNATELQKHIEAKLSILTDNTADNREKEYVLNWINTIYTTTREDIKSLNRTDVLLYYMISDNYLQQLWFLLLCLPISIGGGGVELLINQCISGHSDSVFRVIYYTHRIIRSQFETPNIFYSILMYSLKTYSPINHENNKSYDMNTKEYKDTILLKVVLGKWILNHKIISSRSIINNKLLSHFKRINKNTEMDNLLEMSSKMQDIAASIGEVFISNYSHRVTQFYYENSIISMVQFLLKKVETTTSLITKTRLFEKTRNSLTTRWRYNCLELLSTEGDKFGIIEKETDLLEYLINRRHRIAPFISFIDIEEPLYDHILIPDQSMNPIISITAARPTEIRQGTRVIKQGLYHSETLYKGEITDEESILEAREDMLIAKLVSVTKWALMKTTIDINKLKENEEIDFIKACDISLSTLTDKRYIDMNHFIPLNLGGEILHRIPNQRFKSHVTTRILPNHTIYIEAMLHQKRILDDQLEDTNINFEYIRLMLIMRYTLDYYYSGTTPYYEAFRFKNLNNIHNVQDYKPKVININKLTKIVRAMPTRSTAHLLMRVALSSTAYLYMDDIAENVNNQGLMRPGFLESAVEARNKQVCIDYYKMMNKEYLAIDLNLSNSDLWDPLLDKLRRLDIKYLQISNRDLLSFITTTISEYLHNITYSSDYNVYRNRFECQFNNIRDLNVEHSESYHTISQYLNLNKSKIWEKPADYTYEMLQNRMNHSFTILAKDLFIDLAFGYSMHLEKYNNMIRLDIKSTYESVLSAVETGVMNKNVPDKIKLMINYLGPSRILSIYDRNTNMLINLLKSAQENVYENIRDYRLSNIKFETKYLDLNQINIPELVRDIVYEGFSTNSSIFNNWDLLYKSIGAFRYISETYANPDIFVSPTGSDSFGAQYGLFSKYIIDGVITDNNKICSLAAGRGDGKLATDLLNIRCDHYSRPGIFNQTSVIPGIINNRKFDLTDWASLRHFDSYDFYHIDISNIKGKPQGLEDTILNWIMNGKTVSIRINSIKTWSDKFLQLVTRTDLNIRLYHATNSPLLTYQIYLLLSLSGDKKKQPATNFHETYNYKLMCNTWINLISMKNLYAPATCISNNSIIDMLSHKDDIVQLIQMVNDNTQEDIVMRCLKQVMRLSMGETPLYIDSKTKDYIEKKINISFNWGDKNIGNNFYPELNRLELAPESKKGFKYWEAAYNYSKEDHAEYYIISRDLIVPNLMNILSHAHPIPQERSYWKNIYHLNTLGNDLTNMNNDDITRLWLKISTSSKTIDNYNSNTIREILGLYLVSIYNHNYNWGLKLLIPTKLASSGEKREARKKIAIYRKLSALTHILDPGAVMNFHTRENIHNIEENIVKRLIRTKVRALSDAQKKIQKNPNYQFHDEIRSLQSLNIDSILDSLQPIIPQIELSWKSFSNTLGLTEECIENKELSNLIDGAEVTEVLNIELVHTALSDVLIGTDHINNMINQVLNYEDIHSIYDDFIEPLDW